MPTEKEVLASLRRRLPELLPTLTVKVEQPRPNVPWDLELKVRTAGRTRRLVRDVKSQK